MIRTLLAAAALCASLPTSAHAQSVSQEQIDERYDRALAAGYKALFLCGAIAGAERNGATRSVESVERWELSGIQEPLDSLVDDMRAAPIRIQSVASDKSPTRGALAAFVVDWAEGLAPRVAVNTGAQGCRLAPIGMDVGAALKVGEPELRELDRTDPVEAPASDDLARMGMEARYGEGTRTTAVVVMRDGAIASETYADDFGPLIPQRTWSVAKSLAATVVGAAVERGAVNVQAEAGLGLSPDDPRVSITIDQLLRMASGRYSDTPAIAPIRSISAALP
ncbi:MAG: serine hydrolase [Erythrobacter sp.]|nr:serine hydrolase [Erythrobacter sp.]